ncbi:hypothetical protein NA56DRAFT_659081 [Hyaloscypha hepaticicola]|uniref:Uncharacterized protein n=1 Tax=Hyaloscypha hepaticicola TaxID=2082293 RepID=A0A2J6Q4G8_9HELO|nr:hypothetical protein NA56DRAFT_659081 [Hyaloscypha hepaticicola]
MRLLSIAVLATLPIVFGAPIQLAKTTEAANTKRSESVAAIVKALLDSNRLIARDGGSQSDVMKRGSPTAGLLGGEGGGALSADDLAEIVTLLGGLGFPKRGAISKRQGLLAGLGLGGLLDGLLGGGDDSADSSPPAPQAPASPPSFGTYGNAPSSGGDPSPGNGGTGGSWPPSSGGAGDGGSGGSWPPSSGDPGNGWPGTGEPGSGGAGSGSPGGYTSK